ncbi:MAG: 3-methylornithyl-N6-L-lysine dehydrogenase PylD [Veillonellales bacterium]
MTRLLEEDMHGVGEKLARYDQQLQRMTGSGLAGIAAYSVDRQPEDFLPLRDKLTIGVVPVSSGQGIITGFSQTVQQIIGFLGFSAFVTKQKDVGGLAEAVSNGAQVIFLADDDCFAAFHLAGGKVVDNGEATGRGYAAALALMAGGLEGKRTLVLGAGPVGAGAASFLLQQGANVSVYDIDSIKTERLRQLMPAVKAVNELDRALAACRLVIEATPAADTIKKKYLVPDMRIAAPGIPVGINEQCQQLISGRFIHDVLEIGVASMLYAVLSDEC